MTRGLQELQHELETTLRGDATSHVTTSRRSYIPLIVGITIVTGVAVVLCNKRRDDAHDPLFQPF